jgi:hypothetical protein
MQKSIVDPSIAEKFMKMDFLVEPRNQKEWTAYVKKQDQILHGLLKEMGLIK